MNVFLKLMIVGVVISTLLGCSSKMGSIGQSTHFAFPNSNVTPLGPVKIEKSKFSILIPRNFDKEEMISFMNEAMGQQSGADLIINYKSDVKFTNLILPIYITTYTLEGTAAKMDIGKQELYSKINY